MLCVFGSLLAEWYLVKLPGAMTHLSALIKFCECSIISADRRDFCVLTTRLYVSEVLFRSIQEYLGLAQFAFKRQNLNNLLLYGNVTA